MAEEKQNLDNGEDIGADVRDQPAQAGLESGTYEILRNRLLEHGSTLRERLEKLNATRKDIFGSIEFKLLTTERITTPNNCVPRDMVVIAGNRFLFGYNVKMGLKKDTHIEDVFAAYNFTDHEFHSTPLDFLDDGDFLRDFKELYRYYKQTVFSDFRVIGPHLFMAFQISKDASDIKTFKWSIEEDGIRYIGNRADHEYEFPSQHDFEWKRAVRDYRRSGEHPHISVEDRVFVECVGGDLTIKIEDNTESGEGIYAEPGNDIDQTLDDAEIYFASLGSLIFFKIKPFQEKHYRYLIYNEKVKHVRRIDKIKDACVLLPDNQGVIFSNGYYLQDGEYKVFENELSNMIFSRRIEAPNGEDFLYIFYNRISGVYILLSYNRIEQKLDTPIICEGVSIFESGEMVYFQCDAQPQKHHVLQVWQTPYVGRNVVTEIKTDSFLGKLGNPTIVGCMSECHEVLNLIKKEDSYENLYLDIVRKTTTVIDTYFWLGDEHAHNLKSPLEEIKQAANSAIEEFEKVNRIKKDSRAELQRLQKKTKEIIRLIDYYTLDTIEIFVGHLSALRMSRGEIITARDLRYVDLTTLDDLEKEIEEHSAKLSQLCVEFLLTPEALIPYETKAKEQKASIDGIAKVTEADQLEEELEKGGEELEMLIEIVGNLKIEDSTEATRIIDNISGIYAKLNQIKSLLKNKKRDLMSVEGEAHFNAKLKLISQSVTNYLDVSETVEKCDEYLTKLMVQIEDLEGHFADFDEFISQLVEKREEIYTAFSTKKIQLTEARNRKTQSLFATAERILKGISSRAGALKTIEELNGYFAADLMIEKLRNVSEQLITLEDTVKADDILSRLKTVQQDSVRQLKDKLELFVDGENIIKFGDYRFSVNTQELDITMVERKKEMYFHLTGTDYFQKVEDKDFQSTRSVWEQEFVSENPDVYRAEYLCHTILKNITGSDSSTMQMLLDSSDDALLAWVQKFMAPRYTEGYIKGVHDFDAAKILRTLLSIHAQIGLLKYSPRARAAGRVFWNEWADEEKKSILAQKLSSIGLLGKVFPSSYDSNDYLETLKTEIRVFFELTKWFHLDNLDETAEYLFEELQAGDNMIISSTAENLSKQFQTHLRKNHFLDDFKKARKGVSSNRQAEWDVISDWLNAFVISIAAAAEKNSSSGIDPSIYVDETVALLLYEVKEPSRISEITNALDITELVGSHRQIHKGIYCFNYLDFSKRLRAYSANVVPEYTKFTQKKRALLDQEREDLRLDEFKAKVLTTFVRNQLIDQFYLPLFGSNMAKQIGESGSNKRTDRMGLLLLISPPGYGKTVLMEYVANRLGMTFMKINGPALGHSVTSLDPEEAPNASAKEEVSKVNLALEMGDNIMLYVDDIQHTNSEFLQKFISLCDAQRRIEGVYNGKPRTYDLKGKKVMVVMAGNPYTESGEKFQIPDMLANRADTYNLGDVVSENAVAFERSYLENAVTSNPVLARLAQRSQKDVQAVIKLAENNTVGNVEFDSQFAPEEVNEMVAVMKRMIKIRDVVLKVNLQYIQSAAQAEEYRTEPTFKMQGSYRNMCRLAEKVLPIMNEKEVQNLLDDHYKNEAQTLTTGAESNLLKFREMCGTMSEEDILRWNDIKRTFKRNLLVGQGDPSDPVGRVVVQLSSFKEGLDSLQETISMGLTKAQEVVTQHLAIESERIELQAVAAQKSLETQKTKDSQKTDTVHQTETSLSESTLEALKKMFENMPVKTVSVEPPPTPSIGAEAARTGPPQEATRMSGPPEPPKLGDSPEFAGESYDELYLPIGETRDFPSRVYVIRGKGFSKGAYLYIYDEQHPVVVYDGQKVTNRSMLGDGLIDSVKHNGEEIHFEILSDTEVKCTITWLQMTNVALTKPFTEVLPITVVNPDGKFAPYSSLHVTILPKEKPSDKPKKK
ncbi:MAG: DNA repair ATPase [Candidatus Lindowbacteria bacterium]|nr:DNA repair ATPase [Candidatus Lindowbacteria bacterium]